MSRIDILKQWIDESKHMVFFGGAGVSTESGIPDFRSVDGLTAFSHCIGLYVLVFISSRYKYKS